MYAETDFLLALIKDEDWLGDAAEAVYRDHRDELWTSHSDYCRSVPDRPHAFVRSHR